MTDAGVPDALLIDLGNTGLRWRRLREDGAEVGYLAHGSRDIDRGLAEAWGAVAPPMAVWVSSVAAAETSERLAGWVQRHWGVSAHFVTTEAQAFGIVNGYRQPEQLGVDRWLALIGARQLCRTDVCVVDAGTALTVDALCADGRHLGGYIVPGLGGMRRALLAGTRIPQVEDTECPSGFATDTACAVAGGALLALTGLVEACLGAWQGETGSTVRLLLTGSEAPMLSRGLSVDHDILPNLVLDGLARYATRAGH